jgi:hypothetical protein
MPTLPSRWQLFTGILVILAVVLTVVVLLLPASVSPFCKAERALDAQGPTLSRKFSQAQFTKYVLTEARLQEKLGYTEPGQVRKRQLSFASDLRALATDPLYYKDLDTASAPSPATMLADPKYKKLLDASTLNDKYIAAHILTCTLSN